MMSETGKQIITIRIQSNISRGKDNQIMKFGQLIEYNIRKLFLEKSYPNIVEKLVPDLFPKAQH